MGGTKRSAPEVSGVALEVLRNSLKSHFSPKTKPKKTKKSRTTHQMTPAPPDIAMDPFDSPFIVDDVHPLITQHFTGDDVKNASLVSNFWYKKFAETPKLMDKLVLTLTNKKRFNPSPDVVDVMLGNLLLDAPSQRRYSSLVFNCSRNIYVPGLTKVLTEFSEHLIRLKIGHIHHTISLPAMNFPALKTLEIDTISDGRKVDQIFKAIADVQLEKLSITKTWKSNGLLKYVNSHKLLNGLTVMGYSMVLFRDRPHIESLYEYHLTKLKLGKFTATKYDDLNERIRRNVVDFLNTQAATLEHLSIECDIGALNQIMRMPHLKTLEYNVDDIYMLNLTNLPANETIQQVRLLLSHRRKFISHDTLRAFLSRFLNLRKLQVKCIDEPTLIVIASASPTLETIYYNTAASIKNIKIHYNQHKDVAHQPFNSNIKLVKCGRDFDMSA